MSHGTGYALACYVALVLVLVPQAGQAEEPDRAYRFGVLPFVAPEQIDALYGPLAKMIGQVLQRPVQLRTRASFESFSKALQERQFDIALVQPFDYIDAADRGHYRPVARVRQPLSAILVVPASSPIQHAQQLRGQVIALPPASAAVSQLADPMLRQAGLSPGRNVELTYAASHDACLLGTVQGQATACVTGRAAMTVYSSRRGQRFRILQKSVEIPQSLFVVSTDFPAPDLEKLASLLLTWQDSEPGRKLLDSVRIEGGLVPALDSDYDVVRKLRDAPVPE